MASGLSFAFADDNDVDIHPKCVDFIKLAVDFDAAISSASTSCRIPLPACFTRKPMFIIVDCLSALTAKGIGPNDVVPLRRLVKILGSRLDRYETPLLVAALNTAKFIMCDIVANVISIQIASRWRSVSLSDLHQATSSTENGTLAESLEPYRMSRTSWLLFSKDFVEVLGKEPNWQQP